MDDCLFCKIAKGEIPAKIVHRSGDVIAIEDVNPQAPVHLLVMPVEHYDTLFGVVSAGQESALVHRLIEVASTLGEQRGSGGYRLVVNTGDEGGQTVGHVHIHVLAGRRMTWPPG
ncbi:MAG: HIT domain-containing protein [Candidatus Eremiobacteraeota bacterium]|nr:HIT domain-containing protein [Candidatus Eremiobacteraeota bacterium]